MIISPKHEVIVFWSSFFCGQAIGIFFDFFRCLRKRYPHGKIPVAIEDVIFCTFSFKLFFDICNACNNGALRWYIFAALILSGTLYFCTLSPFIMKLWNFVLNILICIAYPFKKIFLLFCSFTRLILKPLSSVWKKFSYFATKKLSKRRK